MSPEPCDLAILTVIGVELDRMLKAFASVGPPSTPPVKVPGDKCSYWKARIHSKQEDRELTIIIGNVARAGLVASALRTVKFLQDYAPAMFILAGIAAGWKEKLKIGDVIWPRKILDLSESEARDGVFIPRPDHHGLPPEVLQMLQAPWFEQVAFEEHLRRIYGGNVQPPTKNKRRFAKEVALKPVVSDGVIACGDILVRDGNKFADWQRHDPQVRAFEMEAGGMIRAIKQCDPTLPWLVARGISDFGDAKKADDHQPYAAASVAAYVKHFAECGFDRRILGRPPPSLQSGSTSIPPATPTAGTQSPRPALALATTAGFSSRKFGDSTDWFNWEEIREEWNVNLGVSTLERLRNLRMDARFGTLPSVTRARVLRFEAEVLLDLHQDIAGAEALANQADALAPPSRVLEAQIAALKEDPRKAADLLNDPADLEEWNTRMSLLLQAGDGEAVLKAFDGPPEGVGPNAESQRIRALASITCKNLALADQAYSKAKNKHRAAFAFRLAGALLDYFHSLSPGAPKIAYMLSPNPIDMSWLKRDESSLAALSRAATEFSALAGLAANGSRLRRELRHWQLAALANHVERQADASALCAELLTEDPADALADGWGTIRNYPINRDAQRAALAANLNLNL